MCPNAASNNAHHCTHTTARTMVPFSQVVKEWYSPASTSGEVVVSGLSPGNHYFVCSVGNHCQQGMRVNVTVTTDDQQEDSDEFEVEVTNYVHTHVYICTCMWMMHCTA